MQLPEFGGKFRTDAFYCTDVSWFEHEVIGTKQKRLFRALCISRCQRTQDDDFRPFLEVFQLTKHLQAIHLRHFNIQCDDVGP